MTAYTLTKNTNLRDLTVAGGYSARTGGDSISNTNGWSFTIDQDTQYGYGAPAFAATTAGSLGGINQTAASGGDIYIDGTKVWLIPFNTGSGTLVPSLAGVTISGVTCNTIAVYTALNAAPATTGASGWLKVTNVSGTLPSSGTFTSDGFTYTITGAAVRGWIEIVGDDAGSVTLNRLGKFQVRGSYFDLGVTTGNRATTYQVPNNGKQLYVPSIEVQGATWTITGATWANGVATFTTSATHDMLVGQSVTVTGVSTAGYNCEDQYITDLTDTTFSVEMANPGEYVSGGSAVAFEQYPCAGTLACTNTNWVADEDTRRGKVFWNTNATTSLTLPTGVLRFGHDGTNSTGAFCPPAGRKIRIPNVFFTNCTTTARNQNVLPNATLGTRYDFTTTGAGRLDIDKASICWYLSIAQAYSFKLTNSGVFSSISLTEIPEKVVMTNVAIGQEAGVIVRSSVYTNLNTGYTTFKNVVGTSGGTSGTSGESHWSINASANVEIVDCVGWCYAFRTSANTKQNIFSLLPNLKLIRFHHIGLSAQINNSSNMFVKDTKYTDTTGLRQSTNGNSVLNLAGALNSGVVEGLKFVGYRAENWSNLLNPSGGRNPLKIRNIGTYSNPLATSEGPFRNMSWTRSTTVVTVTHPNHGLIVGEVLYVYWSTSLSALPFGSRTIATVVDANTFTLTGLNAGDASGTLSYYVQRPTTLIPNSGNSNQENLFLQRIYLNTGLRVGSIAADNSNNKYTIENVFCKKDYGRQGFSNYSTLNTVGKMSLLPGGLTNSSVYGTGWSDGYYGAFPDVDTCTWTRSGTTLTLTTTSGSHNLDSQSNRHVFISDSSSTVAFPNGGYLYAAPATGGTQDDQIRLTVKNLGPTSGTAKLSVLNGTLTCYMNEGTAENTHYTITAGNPTFNGAGLVRMPTVGDQIIFETPYWVKGYTKFANWPININTATAANFLIEYQIDTGGGYGPWKVGSRVTTANVKINANSTVNVSAAESWIANGMRMWEINANINRDAKVLSGGGSTALTMTLPNNTTSVVSGQTATLYEHADEVIDPNVGFKIKMRITTLIAGAGASNTVGTIQFYLHADDASRQIQLPLDTNNVTFNGLPTGCDVVVLAAGTSTILDQKDSVAGTSYTYTYSGTQSVDVGFIKPGYIPFYIRNLSLTAADSSIPVALTPDRNYT